MSSEAIDAAAASDIAIEAQGLGKRYTLFERPADRLRQLLWGHRAGASHREFWALRDVDVTVRRGEVLGIVGRNGAGKSTLLQMVCGTLPPSAGSLQVRGRVAALLELGAGFNPDFTGIENIYLNAALLGVGRAKVEAALDTILSFADIGAFVSQPVKTYSSGMFMRLAFSVATSFQPDILVVDEALSVGDGAFARKSFDRIMQLRDRGATILFCSHAMYHVQALCERALWLQDGRVRMCGPAPQVTAAYDATLGAEAMVGAPADVGAGSEPASDSAAAATPQGSAKLLGVQAVVDGLVQPPGDVLQLHSAHSTLSLRVQFASDPALACPSVAVGIEYGSGMVVASAGSANDGIELRRDTAGFGETELTFDRLPLLKGEYAISIILACERGLHVYEVALRVVRLSVRQSGLEQGLVTLPHRWTV